MESPRGIIWEFRTHGRSLSPVESETLVSGISPQWEGNRPADGGWVARRFIVCDGADIARLWARIGTGESEELLWVPREDESRARPPGFRSLQGGLAKDSIEKLNPKEGETSAAFTDFDTKGQYSWGKAVRYDGKPMEVGPLARMLVAYLRGVKPVVEAGLHEFVETTHQITDEIVLEPTPGHTPGHVSVKIDSKGERAVITGDMVHHPVQLAEPTWGSHPDAQPERAVQTRRDFVARYGDTDVLVIGTHFSGPTAGHIVLDGDSCRLEPQL